MGSNLQQDVPTVVVANTAEAYAQFLGAGLDADQGEQSMQAVHGSSDRAIMWLGNAKLVVGSLPIAHLSVLQQRGYYTQTEYAYPDHPSDSLCQDIQRDRTLLNRLLSYAGPHRTLQLIPYANTPEWFELVQWLQTCWGLKVLLPESPAPTNLWVKDYIDTKIGFRTLVCQWFDQVATLLPFGVVNLDAEQAATVAHWFLAQHRSCIIKANEGYLGLGQLIFHPEPASADSQRPAAILQQLHQQPFLRSQQLIVEAFHASDQHQYPSAEFFVPPLGLGDPRLTYVCNQLFLEHTFVGILIAPELRSTRWYDDLVGHGSAIAAHLQALGFVGYFDLDALVDNQDTLYLLEVNARRTGGTHVHEAACYILGENYDQHAALLSCNTLHTAAIATLDALVTGLQDLLFPTTLEAPNTQPQGVLITHSSRLNQGEFGYCVIAPSTEVAIDLNQQLRDRVQAMHITEENQHLR